MKTRRKRKYKNWKDGGERSNTDEDGKKIQKEGTEEITEWCFFFQKKGKEGLWRRRETAQKEENASEKFSLEAGLKQDGAGVSLSIKGTHKKDREKGRNREKSQPALSTSHRPRDQTVHPDVLLPPTTTTATPPHPFYTYSRFSLVQFGLDPLIQSRMQPGCSWRCLQSAAGRTASVSHTTESGTWGNPTWLPVPPNDGWTSSDGL